MSLKEKTIDELIADLADRLRIVERDARNLDTAAGLLMRTEWMLRELSVLDPDQAALLDDIKDFIGGPSNVH